MNISGKIYSIVAVMALTVLTINGISFYTLSVYDTRVDCLNHAPDTFRSGPVEAISSFASV